MKIDWNLLEAYQFEELCYDILGKEGFIEREWFGIRGSDKGRDIICKKIEPLLGDSKKVTSYLIQCKKYVVRAPSKSDLEPTLVWAMAHDYDVVLFMISNTISSITRDFITNFKKNVKFSIELFEEKNFEDYFKNNIDIYEEYFVKRAYEIRNKVMMLLSDNKKKNIDKIESSINIPKDKIQSYLDYGISKKLINSIIDEEDTIKYYLNDDFEAFKNISKDLLSSYYNYDYMSSEYVIYMIKHNMGNYLNSKLVLKLDDELNKNIVNLLKISPSALYYVLFDDFIVYKEGMDHLNILKLSDDERKKWIDYFIRSFISLLMEKSINDLHHPNFKNILLKHNIDAYNLSINLKFASIDKLELDLDTEYVVTIMKAKGEIKAGQLLTSDIDGTIKMAGLLLNLNIFDSAVELYNDVLKRISKENSDRKILPLNNKGVCLMRMGKWSDAVLCFDDVLKINPDHKEALKNKQKCIDEININTVK